MLGLEVRVSSSVKPMVHLIHAVLKYTSYSQSFCYSGWLTSPFTHSHFLIDYNTNNMKKEKQSLMPFFKQGSNNSKLKSPTKNKFGGNLNPRQPLMFGLEQIAFAKLVTFPM